MGQRLVVQLQKDGKTIGACYMHWSAYTGDAIAVTKDVLAAIPTVLKSNPTDDSDFAVSLFKTAMRGSELEKEEWELLHKTTMPSEICKTIDRNDGLIALSRKGIEDLLGWSEGNVVIDVSDPTKPIVTEFDLLLIENGIEEYALDYSEDIEKAREDIMEFPMSSVVLDEYTPEQFDVLAFVCQTCIDNGKYAFSIKNDPTIYVLFA